MQSADVSSLCLRLRLRIAFAFAFAVDPRLAQAELLPNCFQEAEAGPVQLGAPRDPDFEHQAHEVAQVALQVLDVLAALLLQIVALRRMRVRQAK